jgi:2-keto-4-pentenoate hydratase
VPDEFRARPFGAPAQAIARRFVAARARGEPLAAFPGALPRDLSEAYDCQEAAIESWPDTVAGWKVGLIGADLAADLGQNRLAGPIFASSVRHARGTEPVAFPVFVGGFAAVEAEFVLEIGQNAPARKAVWTLDEARALVAAVRIGVETAGSPLATINELGPRAVVADFGNNAGLIIGPELADWRRRAPSEWRVETSIDGEAVGIGHGAVPPGGPFESLRFLLELCARRGRPLTSGALVSSGALTGVHDIRPGQTAEIVFDGVAELRCRAQRFAAPSDVASRGR